MKAKRGQRLDVEGAYLHLRDGMPRIQSDMDVCRFLAPLSIATADAAGDLGTPGGDKAFVAAATTLMFALLHVLNELGAQGRLDDPVSIPSPT